MNISVRALRRSVSVPALVVVLAASVLTPATVAASTYNIGWASSNGPGYIVQERPPYTSATGQWTVPAVSSSQTGFSAVWIGIGGVDENSLIQVGTEQDAGFGRTSYSAWWEILPAPAVRITSFRVHPGDKITASVKKVSATTYRITISDAGHGSFTTTRTFKGHGTSAEWIVEAPTVGYHQTLLAKHAPVTFDHVTANGHNPKLVPGDAGVLIQHRTRVAVPSAPDAQGDG